MDNDKNKIRKVNFHCILFYTFFLTLQKTITRKGKGLGGTGSSSFQYTRVERIWLSLSDLKAGTLKTFDGQDILMLPLYVLASYRHLFTYQAKPS